MRKSEPDTKYFVKSLENEVLPIKINENHRKLCKLFTVWFPKGIDDVPILPSLLGFEIRNFRQKSIFFANGRIEKILICFQLRIL